MAMRAGVRRVCPQLLLLLDAVLTLERILPARGQDVGSKLDSLTEAVEELVDVVDDAAEEIDDVGNELDDFGDEIDDVEEVLEDVVEELQELKNGAGGQPGDLQSQLESLGNRMESLETKISEYGAKADSMGSDLTEVKKDLDSTLSIVRDLSAANSSAITVQNHWTAMEADIKSTLSILREIRGEHTETMSDVISVCNKTVQNTAATLTGPEDVILQTILELVRGILQITQDLHMQLITHQPTAGPSEEPTTCDPTAPQEPEIPYQYLPASCSELSQKHPSAPSGYYWLQRITAKVYCDMTAHCCGTTGGWVRLAYIDMTDPSQQCPDGLTLRTTPKRTCGRSGTMSGCVSIPLPAHNVQYSRVCGRIRAYQFGRPEAFRFAYYITSSFDGMSLTYGSPRKHLWSFAAAASEDTAGNRACPCFRAGSSAPTFVGRDHFCDTAVRTGSQHGHFYPENPLWDGEGCGPTSSCCQFNTPPWFCQTLPLPIRDDMELRLCQRYSGSQRRGVEFELIELYIQ